MAKRTVDTKYHFSDMVSGIRRRLLSIKMDAKEIFYEENEYTHDQDPASCGVPAQASVRVSDSSAIPGAVNLIQQPVTQQRLKLPPAPLAATEVVKTIIATTLKVSAAEILMEDTIKNLAAGSFPSSHPRLNRSFKLIKSPREVYSSE